MQLEQLEAIQPFLALLLLAAVVVVEPMVEQTLLRVVRVVAVHIINRVQ
jgi:hypothetical protein